MTLKESLEKSIGNHDCCMRPEKLYNAILTWLKDEMVPEEIKRANTSELQDYWDLGHNSCRSTMLKRLEEMKE